MTSEVWSPTLPLCLENSHSLLAELDAKTRTARIDSKPAAAAHPPVYLLIFMSNQELQDAIKEALKASRDPAAITAAYEGQEDAQREVLDLQKPRAACKRRLIQYVKTRR